VGLKKRALSLLISLFMLLLSITSTPVFAAEGESVVVETPELDYLIFQPENDSSLTTLIGTSTINFSLYNDDGSLYSGSATGYIEDPDGEETYVSSSGTISNYSFDQLGTYHLYLEGKSGGSAWGTIEVVEPEITTTGSLVVNSKSTVSVKITDPDGNKIARESFTVDGSEVGVNSTDYKTLYDGTFSFTMTPTKLGTVKILHGGHIVGSIDVEPAYTKGNRIGGNIPDNASLSVEVAQSGWSSSKYVILTRDDLMSDAMVAVPLSKKYDAPILMTPSNTLDEKVLEEIRSLNTETVLIIGGTAAVSDNVEKALQAEGIYTYRFAGFDRNETAAQVASWVGSSDTVYLAHTESDALAVSAFAAENGNPILLTDKDSLPSVTQSMLQQIDPSEVIILGGTGVISSEVESQLRAQYSVKRWGGTDRYGTQQIILQNLIKKQGPIFVTTSLVSPWDVPNGKPYGNALFVSALAAKKNGFVVTVPVNELPAAVNYALLYNKGYISSATIVGNTGVVSMSLEQRIHELLKH
jgi:putative cell wall-binding protein